MEAPDADPSLGGEAVMRRQPSGAEFMAHLTVELATNMELGAEAREGRRVGQRPEGLHYVSESHSFGREAGLGDEGEEDDDRGQDDEDEPQRLARGQIGKLYEARVAVGAQEVRRVACCEENAPAPVMAEYLKSFKQGMGLVQEREAFSASPSAEPVAWKNERRWMDGGSGHFLKQALQKQQEVFDAWKNGQQQEVPESDEASRGIRRELAAEPEPARLDHLMTPQSFVEAEMEKAASRPKKRIDFNAEQKDFLALLTVKAQELLDAGYKAGACPGKNPDMGTEVPRVKPMRVFLGGPGGAGKSECIDIAGRMLEHFFGKGSKQVLAASNSAARGVGGATVHSGLFLGGQCSFRLASKTMRKAPSPACELAWAPVKALFLEEVSMISPTMLAGISYRLCRARQAGRRWLDAKLYEHEEHMFGGIPIVVMLGDFMQLGAMEKGLGRVSLIMDPKPAWYDECYAGRRIFWRGVTHAVMLRKVHRPQGWQVYLDTLGLILSP